LLPSWVFFTTYPQDWLAITQSTSRGSPGLYRGCAVYAPSR
jgi:hypothetical protein